MGIGDDAPFKRLSNVDVLGMKRIALIWGLCIASGASGGCNLLVPFIFVGEHKRKVPAEFDKLEGTRAVVVVWAEPETLFDYPHVRLEMGTYTGDKIRANVKDCEIVDPFRVEEFLERSAGGTIDPRKVGAHFEADMVVYIELLEFQIRDRSAPDLLRGRVKASLSVYDLRADPDEISRFVLESVDVAYPENQPVLMSSRNAHLIRQQTYDLFSEKVARKFYDHKVDL